MMGGASHEHHSEVTDIAVSDPIDHKPDRESRSRGKNSLGEKENEKEGTGTERLQI